MGNDELLKALGSAVGGGVVSGALILILYKVGQRVVDRLIAAIDRLAVNVVDHTKVDLQHHSDVRQAVVRVEAKVDAVLDARERTPVEGFERVEPPPSLESERRRRVRSAPRGIPLPHGYRPPRGGTNHDE